MDRSYRSKYDAAPWAEAEAEVACGKGRPPLCSGCVLLEGRPGTGRRELPFQSTRLCCVTASPEPPCARPHSQPVRSRGTSARSSQTPHLEGTLTFHKSILHLGQSHLPVLVRVLCPAPPPHAPTPASSLTWNLPGNVPP